MLIDEYVRVPEFIYDGDEALCIPHRQTFDLAGDDFSPVAEMTAQYVCNQCPLLNECRAYALEHEELWGVWGALSRNDRERIMRGEARRERRIRNPHH